MHPLLMSNFGALGKNLNQPRLKFYFGTVSGPAPYATPPCPPLQHHYTHTLMHQHCHMQIHINLLIVVVVVIINTWKDKQTRNKKKKKKKKKTREKQKRRKEQGRRNKHTKKKKKWNFKGKFFVPVQTVQQKETQIGRKIGKNFKGLFFCGKCCCWFLGENLIEKTLCVNSWRKGLQ